MFRKGKQSVVIDPQHQNSRKDPDKRKKEGHKDIKAHVSSRFDWPMKGGTLISRINKVIAIENTPSLNASVRPLPMLRPLWFAQVNTPHNYQHIPGYNGSQLIRYHISASECRW